MNGESAAIKAIALSSLSRRARVWNHGPVVYVEGGLECEITAAMRPHPQVMLPGPRITIRENEPVPQEQFREPVTGTHQAPAGVFPRTHEIAGGFLLDRGNSHRGDFVHSQQPGQMLGVTRIGLHTVIRWALQL